jgi:hypothetical protein
MGEGSSQQQGKDEPFWKALTTQIPNLHALISGHSECSSFNLLFDNYRIRPFDIG